MQTLSEDEIIAAISTGEIFEAELPDGAFVLRIREYVPYVCSAIHAGRELNSLLKKKCLINEADRLQEEDPYTDEMIDSFPITLVARDSRYEYDLNRPPESCIYESAWGHYVWKSPLTASQRDASLTKHARYYRILKALLSALEARFGAVMLVDVHSYNWQTRKYKDAPVFNIGTSQVDVRRWRNTLTVIEKKLSRISLPNLTMTVERNTVFQGRGYQAAFVREFFSNTLIIPLEIKKIFMDEENGEVFPLVLEKLQEGLYLAVLEAASAFNKTLKRAKLKQADLLPSNIEPLVFKVDKALNRLAKNIETLHYVNPINIQQEKRKFLSQFKYSPDFRYRQLRLDPYSFREQLYKLPVSQITDPSIRSLYRAVVDSYATKVELLANVGTPHFLYNSLRYYGEPSQTDIDNARFILHACELPGYEEPPHDISAEEAVSIFEKAAKDYQLDCRVILSTRLVAKAMVDNSRKTLLINRNVRLNKLELDALIQHELGVHMVTTVNAIAQPLHIFKLGLPGNTYTQEGLAILCEYLSGNINLQRLKQLSLRVLAVEMMINGMSFHGVYNHLREDYDVSIDEAFSLCTRVFRGGGFTKDYLYLSGFRDLVALYRKQDISALLIGKTGAQFLDTLNSLIERDILQPPQHLSPAIASPAKVNSPVLDYLVSAIK
ncbi:MAG: flavohemoglobin expression-modulating QEGLA motif protein [Gammaproteobacteria bacterium]|nr:flavohemoglobin expression-modulating QEGLA motif protein [Gammaproteobacteria bacterium]